MTKNTETETSTETKAAKRAGVPFDSVTALVDQHCDERYQVKDQKSFVQVRGPGNHRMYYAKQASCKRIDLAFSPPEELGLRSVVDARGENGAVKHELDTSSPHCLEDLALLLVWMRDAQPLEKAKRTAFVPKMPVIAQRGASSEERKDLIERVAREKGVDISPNAGL